jgi:outer membrane protein OmpA-like peptidoglycan-associated protein
MRIFGKILISLLIFWLWINFATHYYVCALKKICTENPSDKDSIALSKIPHTLTVKTDAIVVLENYPEFIFAENIDTIKIFKKHSDFLDQISAMLKAQPKARLLVIGRYSSKENAAVGTKRTAFIIEKLVKQYSVPEKSILNSVEMFKNADSAGLGFELLGYIPGTSLLTNREDSIFRLQWKDSLTNVTLNGILAAYDLNLNEIKPSVVFKQYCDSLKIFLSSRPNATIQLIGHCDSHIPDAEADKTSLHFAIMTADYLKKSGIKNKITSISKGKKEPLVNDFLPDKSADILSIAKNRRVRILVMEMTVLKPKNKKR